MKSVVIAQLHQLTITANYTPSELNPNSRTRYWIPDKNKAGDGVFLSHANESGKIKVKTPNIVPLVITNHKKIASVDNFKKYLFQLSRKLSNAG